MVLRPCSGPTNEKSDDYMKDFKYSIPSLLYIMPVSSDVLVVGFNNIIQDEKK